MKEASLQFGRIGDQAAWLVYAERFVVKGLRCDADEQRNALDVVRVCIRWYAT